MRFNVQLPLVFVVVCQALGGVEVNGAERELSQTRPVGWRGDGSGRFPSANPVTLWKPSKNLLWTSKVGAGQSSPIVAGQRLFITSEPDLLVCLDVETGRALWQKPHKLTAVSAEAARKGVRHSTDYGDATPTAVSDGRFVWVFFATGLVACHDMTGRNRWMKWYDQSQTTGYGRTASPVLVSGRLLVHFGPLVCLDASTGKVLWQNSNAPASYGTSIVTRIGEVDVAVTPKGQVVRVSDGKILASELGNCMYTSPVVQDHVVYFIEGVMSAVQLPKKAEDKIECKELWWNELSGEFFASPVVHHGRVYTVDKAGNYYVIDANTGKVILNKKIAFTQSSASVYPSLCMPGKNLFVSNDAGETIILKSGDHGLAAGTGSLPGGSGGTPTFSGRRMFARGGEFLYCLGGDRITGPAHDHTKTAATGGQTSP